MQFNSLKKTFRNSEHLLSEYNEIIKDKFQANVIKKLEKHITELQPGQIYYLPHRPVTKER